jgi:phosphoribosyl 1,2-cyclic phosphate phosphodiesterase
MQAVLTILGSGTSMGVPTLGCDCRVCTSSDPRDRRSRPSVTITWDGHLVLIDTGPDFRMQALREGIRDIDAVLYTHSHADHILGLDDLRPLSFRNKQKIPLYADDETARVIESVFDYTFASDARYSNRARVTMNRINGPIDLFGIPFQPIPLKHGDMNVTGFRFGKAAYLTDMNHIPDHSLELLQGLDVAILDALRHTPHPSHSTLQESIEWANRIAPREAYFTHMSHEIPHAETESRLAKNMRLAYDGLQIPFEISSE